MGQGKGAFEALVEAHHARVPPRTGSLLVSIFGVVALPSGRAIRLSDLQEWLGHLGIEAGLVRTALSRLVAEGTLLRERDGKAALYRLSAGAEADFHRAGDLIFGRKLPAPTGLLDLVLIEDQARRASLRAVLAGEGFVPFAANLLARPGHFARVTRERPGCLILHAQAEEGLAERAATLWPLASLAEGYRLVGARARGILAEARGFGASRAFLARILLVHEFRRIVLRDPFLPPSLLPADWPAAGCRTDFLAAIEAL